jgi:hypothetical protein
MRQWRKVDNYSTYSIRAYQKACLVAEIRRLAKAALVAQSAVRAAPAEHLQAVLAVQREAPAEQVVYR